MTFTDAIKCCFSKYATFSGRASRSEYWYFSLFLLLGFLITASINNSLYSVFSLVTFLPSIAASSRRLHDTDRSGWWQLLWFLPLIGWIILLVFLTQDGKQPNRFGTRNEQHPDDAQL